MVKFINIKVFQTGKSICNNDFENKEFIHKINIESISAISELLQFELPFSGKHTYLYGYIRMNNGDQYFLKEGSYRELLINLDIYETTNNK